MEIEVQSPYGTKVGAGPIITGRNWRSSPRMNKIGAFSFEMPLNDPRRSYLVQKRYVRCYGMVDGTRTELGKPGIIDSVVKEVDANGIPTGMLRVSGRDLLAELGDITIHELSLIDADVRIPDSVQYYDGTATAYIDMTDSYNNNPADGVDIPADDEDWHYFGDADVFDVITLDFGAKLNNDTNNFILQYSQGAAAWAAAAILSDTTKVDNASFAQDGSIRWERQEDWATDTVNSVADKYWVRIRYKEDMSGDVTINETTITQDTPTTTALADWLAYTDAAAGTPISDLGWDFWATHQATENTVFLILRDVSAFEALTLIAEQTGENFRLGTGRLIDWLQNDKTASGIRATNISDGIVAEDNEDICLITNLRETEDSYEMISRIYPQGGGQGSTRVTLLECTESAPAGYTLSTSANYLKKDATESDYGRRIEMTKFWPGLASPRQGSSRDVNSSNALYKLAYEYLERHCTPQTSYQFSVVKLDAAVELGETIQLVYWQTVEGMAVWNLGITAALHLWVLEMTHAMDDAGSRVVGMQVATIDAWPSSDASKVKSVVSHIKALQSTDGPASARSLTPATVAELLGSLDLSAYAKVASDETITGTWNFASDLGVGTSTPRVVAGYTYPAGQHLNIVEAGGRARISVQGNSNGTAGAALNLVDLSAGADDKWMQLRTENGITRFLTFLDDGSDAALDNILVIDMGTGNISMIADLTVSGGLNVGTATGAGTGAIITSGWITCGLGTGGSFFFVNGAANAWMGYVLQRAGDETWFVGIDDTTNDLLIRYDATSNYVTIDDATGNVTLTGDVLLGSEDGLGKLNFDEGTAIADGIVWGSDANKVTLYRSADDVLKTDDSLTVALGLNVGAATAAPSGSVKGKSTTTVVYLHLETTAAHASYVSFVTPSGETIWGVSGANNEFMTGSIAGDCVLSYRGGGSIIFSADTDHAEPHLTIPEAGGVYIAGDNVVIQIKNTKADAAGLTYLEFADDAAAANLQIGTANDTKAFFANKQNGDIGFETNAAETMTLSAAGALRIDGCLTEDGSCEIFTEDALAIIADILSHGSGVFNGHGHEKIDMKWGHANYPAIFVKSIIQPYDRPPRVSYGERTAAKSDLLYRATMQLNTYRHDADTEREAIRARLDSIERRG